MKKFNKLLLKIELVPKSLWYANVRSEVSGDVWNVIKQLSRDKAGDKCEIPGCGQTGHNQGFNWTTETHEVWEYDDKLHIQKLVGFVALCPYCHKCKHWGRTSTVESDKFVHKLIDHFKQINGISSLEMDHYIQQVFKQWHQRNEHAWTNENRYLYDYLCKANHPETD